MLPEEIYLSPSLSPPGVVGAVDAGPDIREPDTGIDLPVGEFAPGGVGLAHRDLGGLRGVPDDLPVRVRPGAFQKVFMVL